MIAVIFTSKRTDFSEGYEEFNSKLEAIAADLPGFIIQESARTPGDIGISISYWKDEESAKAFKKVPLHIEAQKMGKEKYYEWYDVKVCKVEKHYQYKK